MKINNTQKVKDSNKSILIKQAYSKKNGLVKKKILAIDVTSANKEEILEYILDSVKNSSKNYYITTPNPEMIVYAQSHPDFLAILNSAEVALCDGMGLFWGAEVLGEALLERFTGVDLVEMLCAKAAKQSLTIGFFGGKPGVAEKAAECLREKYPNLTVVYANDVWDEGGSKPAIDVLFVALGFPKQEKWMAEHLNNIPVRVMVGVGGAFDYLSGNVKRAPKWVQNVGFEWLFRLVVQPWRIKRQLALPQFIFLVLKEKFVKPRS